MRLSYRGLLLALAIVSIALSLYALWLLHGGTTASVLKDIKTSQAGTFQYEIADTPAKQELGLGNRAVIADNYGMLFVFNRPDRYGFWMKDMLTPIDIIWLSDTGRILMIDDTVQPDTYPHVLYAPVPVRYVLETKAGFAKEKGWEVGTTVVLPTPYGNGK